MWGGQIEAGNIQVTEGGGGWGASWERSKDILKISLTHVIGLKYSIYWGGGSSGEKRKGYI